MARNMGEINVNNNKVARHLLKGGQETHFCFVCGCSIVPAPFVEETNFAPLSGLCSCGRDQLTVFVWVYFWALYSVPLIYLSILLPIPHCLDECHFILSLEVR